VSTKIVRDENAGHDHNKSVALVDGQRNVWIGLPKVGPGAHAVIRQYLGDPLVQEVSTEHSLAKNEPENRTEPGCVPEGASEILKPGELKVVHNRLEGILATSPSVGEASRDIP